MGPLGFEPRTYGYLRASITRDELWPYKTVALNQAELQAHNSIKATLFIKFILNILKFYSFI